jgi:hypothetical protein
MTELVDQRVKQRRSGQEATLSLQTQNYEPLLHRERRNTAALLGVRFFEFDRGESLAEATEDTLPLAVQVDTREQKVALPQPESRLCLCWPFGNPVASPVPRRIDRTRVDEAILPRFGFVFVPRLLGIVIDNTESRL